ncbi:hypothetical protein Poly30_28740 [Planctomycetes bacterium Poly30]|uniref:Phytase-like domain-containing protein n=1 Tax=Saltatorellus ferox TaxID=2528018 RepID=A0A518ETD4_9BACT|nr:hypothetical protein Poly30_28740 [Planctomycetes bacterium Poly30]
MQLHAIARGAAARLSSLALSFSASALLITAPAHAAPQQLTTVEDGYQVGPSASLSDLCADGPSYASFLDGSYLVFDGYDVEHRGASGALLRRYASFPFYRFPSFVILNDAATVAYFGESSNGNVYELDLTSGSVSPMGAFNFVFDMAVDDAAGFGYVSAATAGFGLNSVHRIDLNTFASTEVVSLIGFSGPVTVDAAGDLLVARLPDTFPFPNDSVSVLRFAAADLASGTLQLEADATVEVANLDGLSSLVFDDRANQVLLMETNTGTTGFDTILWKQRVGGTLERIAETSGFAGGLEFQDGNIGTEFGPFQPNYTSLTFIESDCFNSGSFNRAEIRPLRPVASFDGPSLGASGSASFELTGCPDLGFASLWIARAGALTTNDVIVDLGGTSPIALRAPLANFGRRFPMIPLNGAGGLSLPFFQDAAIEGGLLAQFLIFDGNGVLLTTSNFTINRSSF